LTNRTAGHIWKNLPDYLFLFLATHMISFRPLALLYLAASFARQLAVVARQKQPPQAHPKIDLCLPLSHTPTQNCLALITPAAAAMQQKATK